MRKALILIAVLSMPGCGRPAGDPEPGMRTIDCALAGAAVFAGQCRVETAGDVLIVHQPDGGFRRLRKVDDGRGVIAADGVEDAHVAWAPDGRLEVTLGQDRYRFPAKVRPDNAKTP
jgi:hypothetical protein